MRPAADFFSGLGGFSEGARQAGLRPSFAANHWDSACEWHARNHPEARHYQQDLQQLDMRLLPDLSDGVLLAGPACQGHSRNAQPARKGTGGSHAPDASVAQERAILQRSTAWAVIAAAEEARPRAIVVENVPDFLDWRLYHVWASGLTSLGYVVEPYVLDADRYGSAQARKRAIITAGLGFRVPLATAACDSLTGRAKTLGDCLDLSNDGASTGGHRWSSIDAKSDRMRGRMRKAQREAGSLCVWNNVSEAKGRPLDELAPTLTTKSGSQLYLLDGDRGRILNPRELARIQGFPDTYQIPAQRELASKLIGNAIPVELARGVCAQVNARMN